MLFEAQKNLPQISGYLDQRGIGDEALLARFQLGYIPDTQMIFSALSEKWAAEEAINLCLELKILIAREQTHKYFSPLNKRLIFPIHDIYGRIIGLAGRTLEKDVKPKYFNTVFHKRNHLYASHLAKNAIIEQGYAIIVEGYMDVVSAHKIGAENVIAVMGTAFTQDHGTILCRYTDQAFLLLDGDTAGQESMKKYMKEKAPDPLLMKVLPKRLPKPFGDVDEMVMGNKASAIEYLKKGIKQGGKNATR